MKRSHKLSLFLLLVPLTTACQDDPPREVPFRHHALYEQVQTCTPAFAMIDGDWKEDFGDAAFYGPAFFAHAGTEKKDAALLETARLTTERNLTVIMEPDLVTGDTNEMIMATLGLIEYIDATGATEHLAAVDQLIDKLNELVKLVQYYIPPAMVPGYAMKTYGPTSINGLVALLSLQRVYVLGGEERRAALLPMAKQVTEKISEAAWTGTDYSFGEERPGLFLYPNITMIIVNSRLYQLTGEDKYRERALATYQGIQPLKVTEASGLVGPGRYRSPYSAETMGATTDNYSTLSSQNYLMFALMLLYQITGNMDYLAEIDPILDFLETSLMGQSCLSDFLPESCTPACISGQTCVDQGCVADVCHCGVLHHWMDGRLAVSSDPESFCSGCNLQLLYLMWYRQHKII